MVKKQGLTWTAPEFVHYPKSQSWFIVLAVIGFAVSAYFFWRRDFLTAVMFLLLFAAIYYFAHARPRTLEITLDARGLKINENQLPYQKIKAFWLIYEPPASKTLNFETTAYLNRSITLQLENEDPVAIRDFLLEYLPEDLDREEQLPDKISRTFRF